MLSNYYFILHLHMQEETSQEEGINKIKKHSGT